MKEVLQNTLISNYFTLVASSLPVKFSKIVRFHAKFEVLPQNNFC